MAPRDDVERVVADIFADVLAVGRVGVHDDFFELGGHSLHATSVLAKVESTFGDVHIADAKATSDPNEVGPVDIVLFAVKLGWLPTVGRISVLIDLEHPTGFYVLDAIITWNMVAL